MIKILNSNILYILIFLILSIFLIYYINNKTSLYGEYLVSNNWSNIWWYKKHKIIDGIEVRVLPKGHLLAGQKGVFATKDFLQYDIIGEYTGIVKKYDDSDSNNLYLFALKDDLVIDANDYGNELRFVNSNMNISPDQNVSPRFCYIDGYPRIFFICIKDIKIGEEILIDYGVEYNKIFLS